MSVKTDDELRDAFALAVPPECLNAAPDIPDVNVAQWGAGAAYAIADAMMAERAKRAPANAGPSAKYRRLARAVRRWIEVRDPPAYNAMYGALIAIEAEDRT